MNIKLISYWTFTKLLVIVLSFSGIGALTQQGFLIEGMQHLGFPLYVMFINGTAYVLAAIAIIAPGFPLLKEWAYAGVIFAMTGAVASHVFMGDTIADTAPAVAILCFAVVSYVLRPTGRRLVPRALIKV